jgi:glycosyltransferase A (GT-A) superfamily protein (DUF2064 family)
MKNVVIIYTKWPEKGATKTRVGKVTGEEFAYELSVRCFDDLIKNIRFANNYDLIVGVNSKREARLFKQKYGIDSLIVQPVKVGNKQEKQSIKFHRIFSTLLNDKNYEKAILIPMDVPYLTEHDLGKAFTDLDKQQFVFGPEHNGGVYLIGVRGPFERDIFENVRWSTENSFVDLTVNTQGKCIQLRYFDDINEFDDLFKIKDKIELLCPSVYELITRKIRSAGKSRKLQEVYYGDY